MDNSQPSDAPQSLEASFRTERGISRHGRATADLPALLTLVVPTFNERDNLPELVRLVELALTGVAWELVFVDDNSPDGTWEVAKALARADARIRCIRRVKRRGLAGACIEGMLSSSATFVGVMDADLQHDESILPDMLARLVDGSADLVIGSRYVHGGGDEGLSRARVSLSRSATRFAQLVLRAELSDAMSGFFMMRRDRLEIAAPDLSSSGFKVLADVVATAPGLRIAEVGYKFRQRMAGELKLDLGVCIDFVGLMLNKLTKGLISVRFVFFVLAGLTGLVVHLTTLRLGLSFFPQADFSTLQAFAAFVAMTSNFFINNQTTYRDRKLKGAKLLRGLAIFYAVCGLGAVANVGMASTVYAMNHIWWLAGVVGAAMSAVWNYSLSTVFIWDRG